MRSCLLFFLVALVLAAPAHAKRRNRAERSLAALWCRTQYEDALRDNGQLRGHERKHAREAAKQRYEECAKKAKKTTSLEDVMIDIREGFKK